MPPPEPASWFLSRRIFLAGVALVFALAFASLAVQVLGLYGTQGIVPLGERMELLGSRVTGWSRLRFPTLFWFGASDALLRGTCALGIGAALLAILGVLPRLSLALCWFLYLSFVCVGSPFLDFQWDALLLETGLLAVVFAPTGLRPFGHNERAPSASARGLVYGLLFKLMVLSGAVKLLSGDASWRDGSALDFHYWTQPLPHRLSVLAASAPEWFQRLSCLVMFAIELGLPLLLLVPLWVRGLRVVVAAGVAILMAAVFLTGNYGFFNLLTAVLCLPLLDDATWRRLLRRAPAARAPPPPRPRWRTFVHALIAFPLALVSLSQVLTGLEWIGSAPEPIGNLHDALALTRSVNSYGLFRVMTKERPEIELEGSTDGKHWLPYRFRYKPGPLERAPVFAGLHMPRLDWQMWFAALEYDRPYRSRWEDALLERLLENSPSVLALLDENPFPSAPPRYVRASVALYHFASPEERAQGRWWSRGASQEFLPARERAR